MIPSKWPLHFTQLKNVERSDVMKNNHRDVFLVLAQMFKQVVIGHGGRDFLQLSCTKPLSRTTRTNFVRIRSPFAVDALLLLHSSCVECRRDDSNCFPPAQ